MCVHPITFLARKIVDEASSLYCYVEARLQERERGGERGTGLRYRLIYNLQFLFFRCLHFTRRSFLPSPPPPPSISLSLFLFLHSFHNSVYSGGIVSPLFSIMKANCATENQETRAWFGVRTIQMPFPSFKQTPFLFSASKTLRLRSEREERRGEASKLFQMSK